ncbi:YceD family protein [Bacillus piscicola]|uniref:YceD family protein n=1 Tax=Bacillus piscicola TaxID=1632684 RepID=UPI001F0977BD|nr:YceD family protein [Bacillus piscicola]
MKWSINQLLTKKHAGLTVDQSVDVSELKERDREIRDITPVHVTGEASFSGDTVSFHLRITGSMILPCSRTLVDVTFPFDIEMTEHFRLDGMPVDEEEIYTHEPEDGYVDLLPYVKENILLELPIQIFADNVDEKEAVAPQEGNDWEVITSENSGEHRQDEKRDIDPRMADLAKFFDKQE